MKSWARDLLSYGGRRGSRQIYRSRLLVPLGVVASAVSIAGIGPVVIAPSWASGEPTLAVRVFVLGILICTLVVIMRFATTGLEFADDGVIIRQRLRTLRFGYDQIASFSLGRTLIIANLREGSAIPVQGLAYRGIFDFRPAASNDLVAELNQILDHRSARNDLRVPNAEHPVSGAGTR